MSLLALVVVIALIGLIVGLVQRTPWIADTFKAMTWWVGVIAAIFAILVAFGVFDLIQTIRVPRLG